MRRNNLKRAIIQEIQISVFCLANACGIPQDRLEYWAEFGTKKLMIFNTSDVARCCS
jgi:hypothetical protein